MGPPKIRKGDQCPRAGCGGRLLVSEEDGVLFLRCLNCGHRVFQKNPPRVHKFVASHGTGCCPKPLPPGSRPEESMKATHRNPGQRKVIEGNGQTRAKRQASKHVLTLARPKTTPLYPLEGMYAAFGISIQTDPLPYDIDLLRGIIFSLLHRLRSISPREAREVTEAIIAITTDDLIRTIVPPAFLNSTGGVSKMLPFFELVAANPSVRRHLDTFVVHLQKKKPELAKILPPLESRRPIERKFQPLLNILAKPSGKGRRRKHWLAVCRQWPLGIALIRAAEYPKSATDRQSWTSENGAVLQRCLASVACRDCDYPSSPANADLGDRAMACTTPESFLREVLAHLHGTTPGNIDKLLQPSRLLR
jgi:Zn ribbon nucleic-acid-binding protein